MVSFDINSPEYQAMVRRAMGYGEDAGTPGYGMTPKQRGEYYANLAHGTYSYGVGRDDLEAQGVQSTANSAEAIRQQLIAYGVIPEKFQDKYGWVDPQTRIDAQQNTEAGLSTFARMQKAFKDAQRQQRRMLAARGMASSGELVYGDNQLALTNSQHEADALAKLFGANRSVYDAYQADYNRRAGELRGLENTAMTEVRDTPLPTAPGQSAAELAQAWQALPYTPPVWEPPKGNTGWGYS